jgi:hypothetical protein
VPDGLAGLADRPADAADGPFLPIGSFARRSDDMID